MATDPILVLAEELRIAEGALSKASKIYNKHGRSEDGELVGLLLARIRRLFDELYETEPTSAAGAAELVAMTGRRLPFAQARLATHLHDIAERLSGGQRLHPDLIWLRAMEAALSEGLCGRDGERAAPLLRLALKGAARPVMVFRAAETETRTLPWQHILGARPAGSQSP